MNIKKYAVIISVFIVIVLFQYENIGEPVENLSISVGIGHDIEKIASDVIIKKVPISMYILQPNGKVLSKTYTGEDYTIAQTRQNRQTKTDKKFILGQEKVYLFSEKYAEYGIKEIVNITFPNPLVNNTGYTVVCKDNVKDILDYKIEGYSSSSDYIYGMIYSLKNNNFFGEYYTLRDVFFNLDFEGKSVVMPYLELKDDGLEITGMAIFNKDKMVRKLDMNETRIMNMLREKNSKGILTIKFDENKYIEIDFKVDRDTKCHKKDGKYEFVINLNLKGDVISNELYKNLIKDSSVNNEVESDITIKVEEMCNDFIKKMQKDYKTDVLNLGNIAAAKYGRNKGIDWNKAVCNSSIKVKANVNIVNLKKGEY